MSSSASCQQSLNNLTVFLAYDFCCSSNCLSWPKVSMHTINFLSLEINSFLFISSYSGSINGSWFSSKVPSSILCDLITTSSSYLLLSSSFANSLLLHSNESAAPSSNEFTYRTDFIIIGIA